jgi:hypothetical protein
LTDLPKETGFEPPGEWRMVISESDAAYGEFWEWTNPNYTDISIQVEPTTLERNKDTEWRLVKVTTEENHGEVEMVEEEIDRNESYEKIFERTKEYIKGW